VYIRTKKKKNMATSLAKKLRATLTHDDEERFDLANYTQGQIDTLCQLTFTTPIEATEPLRFTFIVGGGKLVRQKYDESLPKWLSAALRVLGYEDDRGAALGSEKVFKLQHDLGQNLIYMHVFPEIYKLAQSTSTSSTNVSKTKVSSTNNNTNNTDPKARCLTCTMVDFHGILTSRVSLWLHRRRLLASLQEKIKKLMELEEKMVNRIELTNDEQEYYDNADRPLLEEKVTLVTAEMKAQVTAGKLSTTEREIIMKEMEDKLKALQDKEGAGSRAAEALSARIAEIKGVCSRIPPITDSTRGFIDLRKAKNALASLEKLEAASEGKILSPAERHKLSLELEQKPRLIARVDELYADCKDWFETEVEFETRYNAFVKTLGKGK
jgi:hypothetical protein